MPPERLKEPNHPTQKPVKLLLHLINIASNEGDVVLDPFMGVGSTGVAALQNNRKFIGIELETPYCEAAVKRMIACEANATTLFQESIAKATRGYFESVKLLKSMAEPATVIDN